MGIFGINKYILELGVKGGNSKEEPDDNIDDTSSTDTTSDTPQDNGDKPLDEPETNDTNDDGDTPQDNGDKPLDEPEGDDNTEDNDTSTDDNSEDNNDDPQDNGDKPLDEPEDSDNNGDDDTPQDNGDKPLDEPDDSISSDPDLDDDASDDTSDSDVDDGIEDDNGEQDLGAMEDEIFASLNTAQKTIKVAELKGTFSALYRSCDETLDKVSKLPNTKETAMVYNNVTNRLMDLKKYLEFYITYTFDTKTYLENQAIYQKYLAIYSAIKEALCTVDKKLKDYSKDV